MLSFLLSPTGIFCVLNLVIGTIFITSQLKHQNRGTQVKHDQLPGQSPSPPQLRRATSSFLERVRSISYSSYLPAAQYPDPHEDEQRQPISDQDPVSSQPHLARPPSFLERVRSINYSSYLPTAQYPDPHEDEQRQPISNQDAVRSQPSSFVERVKSINLSSYLPMVQYPDPHVDEQPQPISGQDAANSLPQLERPPSFLERVRSFKFSSIRSDQPDPVHHAVDPREVEEMLDVHVAKVAPETSKMKKSASEKAIPVGGLEEAETMKQRSGSMTSRTAAAAAEDEEVDEKANDFINRFRHQLKLQRMDSILRYREMLNRGASR